jgi:D-3-phosphoglycerate dehydrogenase
VASTPQTRGLIDRAFVEALPEGAFLINTSRGDVVDEDALLWALENRGLRAGLDVYQNEPKSGEASFEHNLANHPNCVGTHHVGASTSQAQQAIAEEAVRVVAVFKETGSAVNCVNLAEESGALCQLVVRHRNQPGVLAQVFRILSELGINVEEMENVLYRGQQTACARIRLSKSPEQSTLNKLAKTSEHILGVELSSIPKEQP